MTEIKKIMMQQIKKIYSNEDAAVKQQKASDDEEMLDDDDVLPLSNEKQELLKMIDDGLQQKASPDDHPDCARNFKSCCIYRVEQSLKKVHEDSASPFHPKLVSIGPFHHNKSKDLILMEEHKWRFFRDFLKSMKLTSPTVGATIASTSTDDDKTAMARKKQCLVSAMQKLEAEARLCYSEMTEFDNLRSNEFRMMMLLDGCFIIQLLLLFQKSCDSRKDPEDPVCTWQSTFPHLRHDLLLLENQLPFIVLHKIFKISGKKKYKLTHLILNFFNPVLYREKVLDKYKKQKVSGKDIRHNHLLHLFMSSFQNHLDEDQHGSPYQLKGRDSSVERLEAQWPEAAPPVPHDQYRSISCVTELRVVGIEFKKRDHHDLLRIEFSGGNLHIPTLNIDDNMVPVLLNFMAYEQRHHSIKPYFTSYLMFLDGLVNTSKDVEYLHYKGIINHGLGSDEEAATLFNKLCKEVVQDLGVDNYLSKVFTEVNQYIGKRRNGWRPRAAWNFWKHEHFRTPWAFSSFLAAVVLLILTFLQTFFTIYAYYGPPSS